MSKLYFTRSGADRIMNQKRALQEKLRITQGQKGEAAEVGGNQWHDNFSFEQLTREEQTINAQIAEVNEKISKMVVVDQVSTDINKLRIGHLATLDVDGQLKTYLVGGFEDSAPNANPPIISYLAPLINPFIGREPGYIAYVKIGDELKQVTLDDIRLP